MRQLTKSMEESSSDSSLPWPLILHSLSTTLQSSDVTLLTSPVLHKCYQSLRRLARTTVLDSSFQIILQRNLLVALLTKALCGLFPELELWPGAAPKSPPLDLYLVTPRTLRRVPAVAAVWRELEQLGAALVD